MCFIPSGHSATAFTTGIYWLKASFGMSVVLLPTLGENGLVVNFLVSDLVVVR